MELVSNQIESKLNEIKCVKLNLLSYKVNRQALKS